MLEVSWLVALSWIAATAATFIGAMPLFFRARSGHAGLRGILFASIAASLVLVFRALWRIDSVALPALLLGNVLALAAHALFWAAVRAHGRQRPSGAFAHDPPEELTFAGPYALVRHPFYLAYVLGFAAAVSFVNSPWLWILPFWMLMLYAIAARQEERMILASPLGQAYRRYSARVGMLVPYVSRFSRASVARSSLTVLGVAALSAPAWSQGGPPLIVTVAGGGPDNVPAATAAIGLAQDTAVAPDGTIYIASASRVYRIDASGRLSVFAGHGSAGFSGDGGAAVAAQLNLPAGVAVSADGAVYIADQGSHRIRRVGVDGVIGTVAGTGAPSGSGDGGPATLAGLNSPQGLAIDAAGNLYIADRGNRRIRRVTPAGQISTVAGTGVAGFSGDGGPATSAQLNNPADVAVDSAGRLFIADQSNQRIRMVEAGIITTVAGTVGGFGGDGGPATAALLNNPQGVAVDAASNLVIADTSNLRIRRVDASGIIQTVAGTGASGSSGDGGVATAATFTSPRGVSTNGSGELLIADFTSFRIRRVDGVGLIDTLAGNGSAAYGGDGGLSTSASLSDPTGAAFDAAGNLFIADRGNNVVRRVTPAGVVSTVAGTGVAGFNGDGGLATQARLADPRDVAIDGAGNLLIADRQNHRIRRVSVDGVIQTIAGTGAAGFSGDGGSASTAQLSSPWSVTVDGVGHVYISDQGNRRIRRIANDGIITTFAGTGVAGLSGDGGPATAAQISDPWAIDADDIGNLYIADQGNRRIRRVDPTGIITTVAGSGASGTGGDGGVATAAAFNAPVGVVVDGSGVLYISDRVSHRVRRVAIDGIITTVAGTGAQGFGGDLGPATLAQLSAPTGVDVDSGGRLFVADSANNRIRRVAPNQPPTAAAGADQTLEAVSALTDVSLDGSASADPDSALLSYVWEDASGVAVGASAAVSVSLPVGVHAFTLTVTDDVAQSSSDTVSVTIEDTLAPSISIDAPNSGALYELNQVVPSAYSCSDPVSAVATCAGTVPAGTAIATANAGPHTFAVTSTDSAGNSATVELTYTVRQGNPIISWPTPATITFGTPLSAAQLNASADTAGVFAYSPAAGTVLAVGTHVLSVQFTPDSPNYLPASATTSITVTEATQLPDLLVLSTSAPGSVARGRTVQILDTTANTASAGDAASSRTTFYLSLDQTLGEGDLVLGSRAVGPLVAGGSSTGGTSVMIPANVAAGDWFIIAIADAESVVAESSESNNVRSRRVRVR